MSDMCVGGLDEVDLEDKGSGAMEALVCLAAGLSLRFSAERVGVEVA